MTDIVDDAAAVARADARPPSLAEFAGAYVRSLRRGSDRWRYRAPDEVGSGWILSRDPLVIHTPRTSQTPLGMASALGRQLAGRPATFLIAIYESVEGPKVAQRMRRAALVHRASHPEHRFIFLCNTEEEQRILASLGELAVFFNHNLLVDTEKFTPLADCAVIGPNGPVRLTREEVNQVYNQAHTGLCLSDMEGAMYASIEYMLAGLPVVSTRNIGGRDVYFDPEYCITTEADPDAVRAAVLELKARRIPRDYIRRRTLAKIEPDRQRFLDFLAALSVELPGDSRTRWPFPSKLLKWRSWKDFAQEL